MPITFSRHLLIQLHDVVVALDFGRDFYLHEEPCDVGSLLQLLSPTQEISEDVCQDFLVAGDDRLAKPSPGYEKQGRQTERQEKNTKVAMRLAMREELATSYDPISVGGWYFSTRSMSSILTTTSSGSADSKEETLIWEEERRRKEGRR